MIFALLSLFLDGVCFLIFSQCGNVSVRFRVPLLGRFSRSPSDKLGVLRTRCGSYSVFLWSAINDFDCLSPNFKKHMHAYFCFVNTPSGDQIKMIELAGAVMETEYLELGHVMFCNKIHK